MSEGGDVSESFADPAACGLAAALLLLFSIIVAVVSGGGGTGPAVAAIDLTFHLDHPPGKSFSVRFTLDDNELCKVNNGEATPGRVFIPSGSGKPANLMRNEWASFRTPATRESVAFTAGPLSSPAVADRRVWGVTIMVQFAGRPRLIHLGCQYSGDFVVKKVEARGQVQGAAGEPPPPKEFTPIDRHELHILVSGTEVIFSQ